MLWWVSLVSIAPAYMPFTMCQHEDSLCQQPYTPWHNYVSCTLRTSWRLWARVHTACLDRANLRR